MMTLSKIELGSFYCTVHGKKLVKRNKQNKNKFTKNVILADGRWGMWGGASSCSQTCGSGISKRFRTCTNPPPMNGGQNCPGQNFIAAPCNKDDCKIYFRCFLLSYPLI
jgi:hypothetical protein